MLSGYFNGIPRELDDAAKVDGCTPLGALFRVILPAARPGVVAVVIVFLLLQRSFVAGLTAGAVK